MNRLIKEVIKEHELEKFFNEVNEVISGINNTKYRNDLKPFDMFKYKHCNITYENGFEKSTSTYTKVKDPSKIKDLKNVGIFIQVDNRGKDYEYKVDYGKTIYFYQWEFLTREQQKRYIELQKQ